MRGIAKSLLIFVIATVWMTLPVLAMDPEFFDQNGNGRITTGEVRDALKAGDLDPEVTCLDEYARRSRNLAIAAGVVPPSAGGVWAGSLLGMFAAIGAYGNLGTFIVGIVFGYFFTIVSAVGLVTWETVNIVRLVKNNKMIRLIAEAYEGKGKYLARYFEEFVGKYRAHSALSQEQFAAGLVAVDQKGVLCDGTATGRTNSSKLRKRLAKRKQIFAQLNIQLSK